MSVAKSGAFSKHQKSYSEHLGRKPDGAIGRAYSYPDRNPYLPKRRRRIRRHSQEHRKRVHGGIKLIATLRTELGSRDIGIHNIQGS